jgi:pilus assembly protein Flp/PilA
VSILRQITDKFTRKEEGQTLVEYGLILSLIAITAIAGMTLMGGEVEGLYGVLETVAETLAGGSGT